MLICRWLAFAVAGALSTACASTPEDASRPREEAIYRTGSNIPARDYRSEHIEVGSPDAMNPSNRPMSNVGSRKPGG
ncbi:MAG: hypothetical protein ABI533_00680 [Betaproteobacteria bacterium]